MNKFLYLQDPHLKGKNSINRQGNYFADMLVKYDEIIEICQQRNIDTILDGGDTVDTPIVSYSVIDQFVDKIEKAELQYYFLFGNHAERYHSKEHSSDTSMAHILRRSKNFKYLEKIEGKDFVICGLEYSHTVEEDLKNGWEFVPDFYKDYWKILIAHAFISPKLFPYASHIVCDDIKTNADLVLVAHYHSQWEKKVGNTQYLDIGCLGRNSVTEANIEPSVIILDTDKRSYEVIKLKSAKAGHEVFDLEKIELLKEKEANLDIFIQSLESVTFQGQTIQNIIENVAQEKKIDREVVNLILQKIEEKK